MKTIEEAFNEWRKTCISALWGKSATEFKSAFKAGAEYALANQWVSVNDMLPGDGVYVITRTWNGLIVDVDCFFNGNIPSSITHWLPIPELKTEEE